MDFMPHYFPLKISHNARQSSRGLFPSLTEPFLHFYGGCGRNSGQQLSKMFGQLKPCSKVNFSDLDLTVSLQLRRRNIPLMTLRCALWTIKETNLQEDCRRLSILNHLADPKEMGVVGSTYNPPIIPFQYLNIIFIIM